MFIGAVATVIVTITQPRFRDTPVVIACKVVSRTGGRDFSGTVHFIGTITTIVDAVTAPSRLDAMFVIAGESKGRAGGA